ncbi:MAG: YcgL domain-containing protein [Mizugakiibacter sp.]|uniref:YcgL domain-containing protein n=1 Tax=Mizugakiibacter sp. TaxID=1972610 RepID=UPI0031CB80F3|nr:YcgL domain-containing protein [Xanthomonadaceae bacterium]
MHAYVYKSLAKADTYVYLRERDAFGALPATLARMLGELRFVLEVELSAGRRLAREDPATVRASLAERGWHLQLPPGAAPDRDDG